MIHKGDHKNEHEEEQGRALVPVDALLDTDLRQLPTIVTRGFFRLSRLSDVRCPPHPRFCPAARVQRLSDAAR
jgi:hypothetical protein